MWWKFRTSATEILKPKSKDQTTAWMWTRGSWAASAELRGLADYIITGRCFKSIQLEVWSHRAEVTWPFQSMKLNWTERRRKSHFAPYTQKTWKGGKSHTSFSLALHVCQSSSVCAGLPPSLSMWAWLEREVCLCLTTWFINPSLIRHKPGEERGLPVGNSMEASS